jgi:hypothetical protein
MPGKAHRRIKSREQAVVIGMSRARAAGAAPGAFIAEEQRIYNKQHGVKSKGKRKR